jgi:hypothetical protein
MLDMNAFSLLKLMTYGLLLCVSVMPTTPARSQPAQANSDLPVLYGVKLDDGRIAIDVASSGCTDASYFSVRLEPASPDTYRLTIVQNRQDRCRMSAHVVTLTLDIPAVPNLTGANFLLTNRLAAPVALPRSDP